MNLYEMTNEFENELDAFDAILNPDWEKNADGNFITEDGEIITPDEYRELIVNRFKALDEMEQDVQAKAENVACYIKNLIADAEKMKAEEDRLRARRKAKENTAAHLKKYLSDCMEAAHLKKIDMPRAVISIRNNAESVEISDADRLIRWAQDTDNEFILKYRDPEISRTALKPMLKDGAEIPGASLVRTQSVIIK